MKTNTKNSRETADTIAPASSAFIPSPWKTLQREIMHDKLAFASLIFFVVVVTVSFIWAATFDSAEMALVNVRFLNLSPGYTSGRGFFLLGTDPHGRAVLGQLVVGARNSFVIAFTVALTSSVIGILIGLFAGFVGGHFDNIVMRIIDFFTVIPTIMVIIVLVVIVQNHTPFTFGLIMVLFSWIGMARQVRMKTMQQGTSTYIQASKTLGTRNIVIIFRELFPNIISFVVVNLILLIAGTMGIETGLTFLGFGLPSTTPSLGAMIAHAQTPTVLQNRLWQWLPAALLIFMMMLSINYVGQALNRAVDAKRRKV